MKTNLIYYQKSYQKELTTTITALNETPDGKWNLQLAETIFYPEGGGQPGDKGEIIGPSGRGTLLSQKFKDDKLIHVITLAGNLKIGESVTCRLDWNWRYKYMKIHSAGHLIHDTFMTLAPNLTPLKGSHGKKAFIEYSGKIEPSLKTKLEFEVNNNIQKDLNIVNGDSTVDKLTKECQFIPPNLPKNKPLRYIKINDFPPMPDGGVHVKSTQEIGRIRLTSLQSQNNHTKITYQVINTKN